MQAVDLGFPPWPKNTLLLVVQILRIMTIGLILSHHTCSSQNLTRDMIYQDCNKGSGWGCLGVGQAGCLEEDKQNCRFVVSYMEMGAGGKDSKFAFRLLNDAPTAGSRGEYNRDSACSHDSVNYYLSIGFSLGDRMGDDIVVSCIHHNNGVNISMSVNGNSTSKTAQNLPWKYIPGDVVAPANPMSSDYVAYVEGQIICRFTLEGEMSVKPYGPYWETGIAVNFRESSYYILMACGKSTGPSTISNHFRDRYYSNEGISFQSADNTYMPYDRQPEYTAIRVHIVLMVLACVIFLPMAMLLARFHKECRPNIRYCHREIWFLGHATFAILGVTFVILGNVMIGAYIGSFPGLYYKGRLPIKVAKYQAHIGLGTTLTITFCLNIATGIYMSFTFTERGLARIIVAWFHWFFGIFTYSLAMIQFFITPYVLPDYMDLKNCTRPSVIVLTWVILHILVYAYLTYLLYRRDKRTLRQEKEQDNKEKGKATSSGEKIKATDSGNNKMSEQRESVPKITQKKEEDVSRKLVKRVSLGKDKRSISRRTSRTHVIRHHSQPPTELLNGDNFGPERPSEDSSSPSQRRRGRIRMRGQVAPFDSSPTVQSKPSVELGSVVANRKNRRRSRKKRGSAPRTIVKGGNVKPPRKGSGRQSKEESGTGPETTAPDEEDRGRRSTLPELQEDDDVHIRMNSMEKAIRLRLVKKKFPFGEKPPSKSQSLDKPHSRRTSADKPPSRMQSTDKLTNKVQSVDKDTNKAESVEKVSSRMQSIDKTASRVQSAEKIPNQMQSLEKIQGRKSSGEKGQEINADSKAKLSDSLGGGLGKRFSLDDVNEVLQMVKIRNLKHRPSAYDFEANEHRHRYSEAHDTLRAFRSFPLRKYFVVENENKIQVEVILGLFFLMAVVTSGVLSWSLFPPAGESKGQCVTENGQLSFWWK